jgi:phosphoenolpyruvate carboxykinase (GTP)
MISAESWVAEIPHVKALKWIQEIVEICQPSSIHICNGSKEEYRGLCQEMVAKGTLTPLNPELRPNSFLARSDPQDVARVEEATFICSFKRENAGPTNHWSAPTEMKVRLLPLFKGAMRGRKLYVIPFIMGLWNSDRAQIGIQITDSPYVVANMRIMTRMGHQVWKFLGQKEFVSCLHSVGMPLNSGINDVPWPCNPKQRVIAHFPETKTIWSYGSGYGGNALLGKKCFALRIASSMAQKEGWLAEHMLIMGLTNPKGEKHYIAAAFPSSCGKTNLAMLTPTLPGWKVETVGDDIAWMKFGEDGRLYAINPESGFFGVASGTSNRTNLHAMATMKSNSLFTNVALTDEGDVWWEGMSDTPPKHAISWLGHEWTSTSNEKAAHPNSRFTAPADQCPCIDPEWENPKGVPISAILFGGRRTQTTPLVVESFNWQHGVFLGACLSSEMTAAASGTVGQLRHDPFAMLPFCGYNMADYFAHWFQMGKAHRNHQLPSIYYVNWFRKSKEGTWLWPGFGDNCRVLKWITERVSGTIEAKDTPIGRMPLDGALDVSGLELSSQSMEALLAVDCDEWLEEADRLSAYFTLFGSKLPSEITEEIAHLKQRLHSG